ncbi:MAG TPA: Nramp family divalent metal transporter [Phenylobacterium sp.]
MSPPPLALADAIVDGRVTRRDVPSAPIRTGAAGSFLRKLLAVSGPGYLVAVGYMDPGNWATGIAAGSAFGYRLLWVIVAANLLAMFLQHLAAKLGIVTGLDLAQACRARYSRPARLGLWLLCETAIVACELAEVLGAAIALKLLFGIPLVFGVVLTSLQVLLVLALQGSGLRRLEVLVIATMAGIGLCFGAELLMSQPALAGVARGLIPGAGIVSNPQMLYLAIGILGATVMPHNLYLHSAAVRRSAPKTDAKIRESVRFATFDVAIALVFALFVNAAILILAASSFNVNGLREVVSLEDAYSLLTPTLGASLASTLFAAALLASGQNSSLTGAVAGQIVMEGFTDLRLRPWVRRLGSRLLAVVPAVIAVAYFGENSATRLLIFSQVILSLQLPFAVVPLIRLTGDRRLMGVHVNPAWAGITAWLIVAAIMGMNAWLLVQLAIS